MKCPYVCGITVVRDRIGHAGRLGGGRAALHFRPHEVVLVEREVLVALAVHPDHREGAPGHEVLRVLDESGGESAERGVDVDAVDGRHGGLLRSWWPASRLG